VSATTAFGGAAKMPVGGATRTTACTFSLWVAPKEPAVKLALSVAIPLFLGTAAGAVDLAPMALNSFSKAPEIRAKASVMDQSGRVVGTFQQVMTDPGGKPSAISYVTPEGKLVIVAAAAVGYDGRHLVTADSPPLLARR
jgi:hypothetical protein